MYIFFGSDLKNSNFNNAILYGTNLQSSNLEGSTFKNAIMSGSLLRDANAENVDFSNAKLHNAELYKTNLVNADFTNSDAAGLEINNSLVQKISFDETSILSDNVNLQIYVATTLEPKTSYLDYIDRIIKNQLIERLGIIDNPWSEFY